MSWLSVAFIGFGFFHDHQLYNCNLNDLCVGYQKSGSAIKSKRFFFWRSTLFCFCGIGFVPNTIAFFYFLKSFENGVVWFLHGSLKFSVIFGGFPIRL